MGSYRTGPDGPVGKDRKESSAPNLDYGKTTVRSRVNTQILTQAIQRHVPEQLAREFPSTQDATGPFEKFFAELDMKEALEALTHPEDGRIHDIVDRILSLNPPFHLVCRRFLTPLATELGDLWSDDRLNFIDVTVASMRLNTITDQLIGGLVEAAPVSSEKRSVVLAGLASDDHSLGLSIVSACFREAGWHVEGGADLRAESALFDELQRKHYALLGLSVASVSAVEESGEVIRDARRMSKNPCLKIMLGGPAMVVKGDVFDGTDADFMATDALEAVHQAERLVA